MIIEGRIRRILCWLYQWGLTQPLIYYLCRHIKPLSSKKNNKTAGFTLLALTHERFDESLVLLERTGQYRVYLMPFDILSSVTTFLLPEDFFKKIDIARDFYAADLPMWMINAKKSALNQITTIVSRVHQKLGIDAVVTASLWYWQDYLWGEAAKKLGYAYVLLHKENLATGQGHKERVIFNTKNIRFQGDDIIVHNQTTKDCFVTSNVTEPNRIHVLGCMRMDGFLRSLKAKRQNQQQALTKQVVLFSFHQQTGLWGVPAIEAKKNKYPFYHKFGLDDFFHDVHVAFAAMARRHPDVAFVIKTKWGGHWVQDILYCLQQNNLEIKNIPNLSIYADERSAHEFIMNSQVVVGYGSTTLLESAVAGLPVIIPLFAEAGLPHYQSYVQFCDHFDLFDVARSVDAMISLITHYLNTDDYVSPQQAQREALFEAEVSTLTGNAVDAYNQLIVNTIKKSRQYHETHFS